MCAAGGRVGAWVEVGKVDAYTDQDSEEWIPDRGGVVLQPGAGVWRARGAKGAGREGGDPLLF